MNSEIAVDPPERNVPFDLSGECDLRIFRDLLAREGFSASCIEALKKMPRGVRQFRLASGESRLAGICLLFCFDAALSEQVVRNTLSPVEIEPLLAIGILRRRNQYIAAGARITTFEHLLLVQDTPLDHSYDSVFDLIGPSRIMAAIVPRDEVDSVLDVGTGTGCHALLASRHARRVIATDISARAINFASMNARLNGISGVEFRQASLFEGVRGERFNLIVVNLPLVISPESCAQFRDDALSGDSFSKLGVRLAAEHLEEGGYAVVLVNWYYHSEECWTERPAEWVEDLDCDVWWLRMDRRDPLSYAEIWYTEAQKPTKPLEEWLNYYAYLGAAWLSTGVVVLRKRSTGKPNWQRFEDFADLPGGVQIAPAGDQIQTIFAAEDYCASIESELTIMEGHFRLHPAHSLEEERVLNNGIWTTTLARLKGTQGILYCTKLDPLEVKFLTTIGSGRTVRETAIAIAAGSGIDAEASISKCLELARTLVENGLIVPVATDSKR